MRPIKRAIHLDFHTMPGIYDFNREWDAAVFAQTLADAKVCYINAFAKCNLGFAYYPTSVGVPYPGMKGDMFGDLLRECHKRNIGVSAYMNVGLDHERGSRFMDQTKLSRDGEVITGDRTSYGFRQMCYKNPDYRAYLLGMVQEIARYDIDGFFADCMFNSPCYCTHCLADRKARGMDLYDPDTAVEHAKLVWLEFSEACKEIIGPDRYLILNNLPYYRGRNLHTHAEVECLPGGGWSYDYFWPHAVYNRTFLKKVVYMTGRFQASWGDFGGFKSKASLENDYYDALCTGTEVMVGDHMHPARNLEPAVYRTIGQMNAWIERLEPWTEHSVPVAEIAALTDTEGWLSTTYYGLARLLCELKQCFEIIHVDADFSRYKLLILPDTLTSTPELAEKLDHYLKEGGRILSTGTAGLAPDKSGFILPQWAFDFEATDNSHTGYYHLNKLDDPKIYDMDYSMYGEQGVLFRARSGESILAESVKAYSERYWDGFHGYFYTPPEKKTGYAAAAISGPVGHIAFDIFKAYFVSASYPHKALVRQCLAQLLPDPFLKTEGIPSTARVTAARNDSDLLIHVKVTHPEVRGKTDAIEEHGYMKAGAVVCVRGAYRHGYTAPDRQPVEIRPEPDGRYTRVILPAVEGYRLIVLN
ncbi:MAG: alpha-amylase family protein [Clostridiaceae bacterium]|nr:alpha-amylase family protein [Clostridiaceae bacterium]